MSFSFDQLRYFVEVVNAGSFSAAARELKRSQSVISTSIANLEIDLGVNLFDRSHREPKLTIEGEHLLTEVKAVLIRCESLQEHANAFVSNTETDIRLALDNAVSLPPILNTLSQWQNSFPTVSMQVTRPIMPAITQELLNEQVDLALMLQQPAYPESLNFCRLGTLTMIEAVHHSHPIASMKQVSFEQLSDFRQIIYTPHGKALATSEYVISPVYDSVDEYKTLIDLISAGLGWAMIPRHLVAEKIKSGEIVKINIAAYPYTPWLVGVDLLWKRGRKLGRAGVALRERLTKVCL